MRKSMSSFEDLKTSSQGANLTQSARTVDWSNNVYGDDFCDCDPVQTQLFSTDNVSVTGGDSAH